MLWTWVGSVGRWFVGQARYFEAPASASRFRDAQHSPGLSFQDVEAFEIHASGIGKLVVHRHGGALLGQSHCRVKDRPDLGFNGSTVLGGST